MGLTAEQALVPLLKESEVSPVFSLTGERESVFRFLCSWVTIRLRSSRYLFVSDGDEFEKKLKARLPSYTKQFQFVKYGDLVVANGIWARGCSVVLVYPDEAFRNEVFAGRIDGGLVRLAARGLWRNLVVTRAVSEPLAVRGFGNLESVVKTMSSRFQGKGDSTSWLNELLLTLLYKRHLTVNKLLKEMRFCIWSQQNEVTEDKIREALGALKKLRVLHEKVSQYTCTDYGRLLIEKDISLKQFDVKALDIMLEQERRFGQREKSIDVIPDAQTNEVILKAVSEGGWTSTQKVASRLRTEYSALHSSLSIIRRLLERLKEKGVLTKGVYNRGVGRPVDIYFEHGKEPSWLWEQCRGCAFYIRNLRRCRLWWSIDRFDRNTIHGQWDSLSPMAREKLRYGITGMGPKATACEHLAPRKRDFPIKLAAERCLGCGTQVELQLANSVICGNCGTEYRPARDRILVLYNYEHIFRQEYAKIVGKQPPSYALILPESEATTHDKELFILYPEEKVTLGESTLRIQRRSLQSLQRYERISQVVDYGALTGAKVDLLRKRGIRVVQRSIQSKPAATSVQAEIATNLQRLREEGRLTRILAEALMRSVIIATKRNIELLGVGSWDRPIEVQLVEYARLKRLEKPDLDTLLAFEGRINNQYWQVYKTRLRAVGLDFQSRVKDRFVRKLALSVRARARGYSPVNAAINYLHQRRLMRCGRTTESQELRDCEGLLHAARRKQGIGLLLDLSEPFKLADREKLLEACLQRRITREDFISNIGRQRMRYYYPSADTLEKLEKVGYDADQLIVVYGGRESSLTDAYSGHTAKLKEVLLTRNVDDYSPFVFGTRTDLEWMENKIANLLAV